MKWFMIGFSVILSTRLIGGVIAWVILKIRARRRQS